MIKPIITFDNIDSYYNKKDVYFDNYLDKYFLFIDEKELKIITTQNEVIFSKAINQPIFAKFSHDGNKFVIIEESTLTLFSLPSFEVLYSDKNFELYYSMDKTSFDNVFYKEEYDLKKHHLIDQVIFSYNNKKIIIIKNNLLFTLDLNTYQITSTNNIDTDIMDYKYIQVSYDSKYLALMENYQEPAKIFFLDSLEEIEALRNRFYTTTFSKDNKYILGRKYFKFLIVNLDNFNTIYERVDSDVVYDISNNSQYLAISGELSKCKVHLLDFMSNNILKYYNLPKDRLFTDAPQLPDLIEFTENEKYLMVNYTNYAIDRIHYEDFHLKIDNGCYGYVIFNVETGEIYRDFQYEGINVFRITSQGKYILYENNKTKKLTFGEIIYNN